MQCRPKCWRCAACAGSPGSCQSRMCTDACRPLRPALSSNARTNRPRGPSRVPSPRSRSASSRPMWSRFGSRSPGARRRTKSFCSDCVKRMTGGGEATGTLAVCVLLEQIEEAVLVLLEEAELIEHRLQLERPRLVALRRAEELLDALQRGRGRSRLLGRLLHGRGHVERRRLALLLMLGLLLLLRDLRGAVEELDEAALDEARLLLHLGEVHVHARDARERAQHTEGGLRVRNADGEEGELSEEADRLDAAFGG